MSCRLPWLVLGLTALAGCTRPTSTPPPQAAAAKPRAEAELTRTTISKKGASSLGLESAAVRPREAQEHLRLPGWVAVPQGSEVTLTAPVAGYVRQPEGGGVPVAGFSCERDRLLFLIEPVLTPVDQLQFASLKRSVEGELSKAAENVRVAEQEVKRFAGLRKQGLRGEQDLEQARGRLQNAREDLAAARDKVELL